MYSSQEPWRRPVEIPHRPPLQYSTARQREWVTATDDDEPPPANPRQSRVM